MGQPRPESRVPLKITLPYPERQARQVGNLTVVIIDPDVYLTDANYVAARRSGRPALQNLWAFDSLGVKQWEAELPESNDYYYAFVDGDAIVADSFSGFACEISPVDGSITKRVFHK